MIVLGDSRDPPQGSARHGERMGRPPTDRIDPLPPFPSRDRGTPLPPPPPPQTSRGRTPPSGSEGRCWPGLRGNGAPSKHFIDDGGLVGGGRGGGVWAPQNGHGLLCPAYPIRVPKLPSGRAVFVCIFRFIFVLLIAFFYNTPIF